MSDSDRIALNKQLASCQVIASDNDGIWLKVADGVPPVSIGGIDLTYKDTDGEHVEFIIAFVSGHLNWVDYYRNDEVKIHKSIPSPSDLLSHKISCA